MRSPWRGALWAVALALCSCNGQGTTLLQPGTSGSGSGLLNATGVEPGPAILQGPIAQSTLGIYSVDVNLDTLSATTTLARTGAASDNTYELPLAEFMTSDDFEIVAITKTPSTVDVTYRVKHPIAAAQDLDAAPTASNRADLGAVLRVLFLNDVAQVEGNTFFAGDSPVVAETSLVMNAHGYFMPKGLVKLGSSTLANTFPYRLVVDEAAEGGLGNRDGIPGIAGSYGMGNYDPFNGGWQRANIGSDLKGWTGYGVLHQGQTATSTVRLNRALLGAGSTFTFDTALVAKYIDPRGGATGVVRRSNRLPKADGDPIAFAYRMPYGALDCEAVRFGGESGGFTPDGESYSVLSFHVRDYDARAVETTVGDLALDPNVSSVQRGGAGVPSLSIDVPGVIPAPYTYLPTDQLDDDSAFNGDPDQDTGMAGDELFYSATIIKPSGPSTAIGTYAGLAKVVDAELEDDDRGDYYFAIDDQLQPLPAGLIPEPITYQAFNVLVTTPNATPQATASFVGGTNQVASGGTVEVQIDSLTDGEGDSSDFTVDYEFDGNFFTDIEPVEIAPSASFPVVLGASDPLLNQVSAAEVSRTVQVRYTDGYHADQIIDLPIQLGGNNQPTADIAMVNPTAVVGTIIEVSVDNEFDAEGNPVSYDIDWDWDGVEAHFTPDFPWINLSAALAGLPHAAPATIGTYQLGVRIKDALHPAGVIVPLNYTIVPPNTQSELKFSLPATVNSAETISLTVTDYTDIDGDPTLIRIDWNGDLDFNDPGENSLPPVTMSGQVYTSPVLINNLSATPRPPVTVIVEYTDNISPHPVVTTPVGDYVLGGNRPPVVGGAPILQTSTLAPAAIFRVLQNGATASDPEGNAITYTLRGVPNSGAASNLTYSNFSAMLSNPYMNPPASSVAFTVYANDTLHPTTAGTAYPGPLTGTICDLYLNIWNFDGTDDGWVTGELFLPTLPNTDGIGWSSFQRCANMGSGMVGDMWTTGPDTGEACDFRRNDYGPNLDNNVVSPAFSLVGLSKANVVFNSTKTGRLSTCHYRVYASTNDGSSWTQIYDTVRTGATAGTTSEANVTVSLNAYVGQPNVRLRFRMDDSSTQTFGAAPFAGWSFDAVRITGCP